MVNVKQFARSGTKSCYLRPTPVNDVIAMKTRSTTMPKDQAAFNVTGEQQRTFEQLVTLLHPYSTKLHNRVSTLAR
ncbi:MAG TPA: hypothetical protein VG737_16690, partial [Cyclobacteriaceae bacterium]|nr:hypothetical protein [Cyclobacteriaceae bacterium]